jgi:hypothetical protein
MLAQKLALEHDEEEALAVANVSAPERPIAGAIFDWFCED